MAKKYHVVLDAELEDLIPRFMEIRIEDSANLKAALKARDGEQVAFWGHRLKGSGGGYGFHKLSEFGTIIEQAGLDGDLELAARTLEEMSEYMDNLEITYEEMG